MLQQIIALIIIAFLLARQFLAKKKSLISNYEFIFWLVFWLLATAAIILLKWIDQAVASLGFSGTGIEVLFYLGVVVLFYLIFKLRLKLEKIEKDITKIVREITLNK